MKKIKFSLVLLLCIVVHTMIFAQPNKNPGFGRSAFRDAANVMNDNAILLQYFKDSSERKAFLDKYGFNDSDIPQINAKVSMNEITSVQAGNDVAALSDPKMGIDALGTFIANRFKQEINIAFLNKFKADIDGIPNLKLLFPESKKVLVSGDPYNYPVFMETLREAFAEDVNNLPRALPEIIPKLAPDSAELKTISAILLKLVASTSALSDPVTALNDIAGDLPANVDSGLKAGVHVLVFVTNALYDSEGTGKEMFINAKEDEFSDPGFIRRYLVLLVRQNETFLPKNIDVSKISILINRLYPVYAAIADQVATIATQNKQGKLTPQLVQESFAVLLKGLKDAVAAYRESGLDTTFNSAKIDQILADGETINNTARLIIEKKYGLALINVITFVDRFAANKLSAEQKVKVIRYTSFITNVLTAESKDDMVQALETSANPVGSYRVKRNSTFNISLNAYAGGFYGSDFNKSEVFGFTAPIGLYVGWGNLGKEDATVLSTDDGKSLGFFFSLIDVGAVTAFRLKDGETEIADVSWSNVFSPGAYLTVGLGKCPVSINVGGQVGPEITSIDDTGTAVHEKNQWHWRAAITIDIPFFDLYIKQKRLE